MRYYEERTLYYPGELVSLFDAVGRAVRMEIFSSQDAGHRDPDYWAIARENLAAIERASGAAHSAIRTRLEELHRGDASPTLRS